MDSSTTNNFNISAEKDVQNRIQGYDLNKEETSQIWQSVSQRSEALDAQKEHFEKDYNKLFKTEYDKLRGDQEPAPRLEPENSRATDAQLRSEAHYNVQEQYLQNRKGIYKEANRKIDKILEQARNDGRGRQSDLQRGFSRAHGYSQQKNEQQRSDLQREFKRVHDHR